MSISFPVSYCSLPPVPISPKAANRTESGLFGTVNSGVAWRSSTFANRKAPAAMSRQTMYEVVRDLEGMIRTIDLSGEVIHVVHNQIGFDVAQNEAIPDEPILEFLRERWKVLEKRRRS